MAYNGSAIGTAKKLTLAPIVGHLEETKPFARASDYQPGAGPVDEKSNSSLSGMAIQPLRASSKNNRHHNSTAQNGIQKFQTTGQYTACMQATYLASNLAQQYSCTWHSVGRY